jgi:hypothetical protein
LAVASDQLESICQHRPISYLRNFARQYTWRGIYYIFYPSDGKGYVGSAYGENNLYGRWAYHVKVGGDSVQLRKRQSENFEFSMLEILRPNADPQEAIDKEGTWKRRLHTRMSEGGLNEN